MCEGALAPVKSFDLQKGPSHPGTTPGVGGAEVVSGGERVVGPASRQRAPESRGLPLGGVSLQPRALPRWGLFCKYRQWHLASYDGMGTKLHH